MSSNNMLAAVFESILTSHLTPADHQRIKQASRTAATLSTLLMLCAVAAGLYVLIDMPGTDARLGLVVLGVCVMPLLFLTLVAIPNWAGTSVKRKILDELHPSDD